MLKISGPVGAAAFVSALLLSGTGSGLFIDGARADNCLAAPKTAAPGGQHWYYHVDRASRRKCWYLHAGVALGHRAAIRHHAAAEQAAQDETLPAPQAAAAPAPVSETPAAAANAAAPAPTPEPQAATPSAAAPAPESVAQNASTAPHITVLAVRPSTPFVSTTSAPQQSIAEKASEPPGAQMPAPDDASPSSDGGKQAADNAEPRGKADAAPAPAAQTADAAMAARTRTAEMFILLALVFGATAAVFALVSRILGIYRRPRISDDADTGWPRYRSERQHIDAEAGSDEQDVPFVDPREHHGLADLHAQEWIDTPTPEQNNPAAPSDPNPDPTRARSREVEQKGIEPALRILQQARQNRVA